MNNAHIYTNILMTKVLMTFSPKRISPTPTTYFIQKPIYMYILYSRLYGLAQNVSTVKHCSTLEIFSYISGRILKIALLHCFFTTKYALYIFLFLQVQSIQPKTRAFNSNLKSISTSEFQLSTVQCTLQYTVFIKPQ